MIRISPFDGNHFSSNGSPLIGVAVDVHRTLFVNMTGMDPIATNE